MTAGSITSMYKFTYLNANPTNFPASKSALGASFSGSDPGPRRRRDFQELPQRDVPLPNILGQETDGKR